MLPFNKLRMNNIFNGGGGAEYGPPDMNGGMDFGSLLSTILPLLRQKRVEDRSYVNDDRAYEERLHTRDRNERMNSMPQVNNIAQNMLQPQKQVEPVNFLPPTYNGMSAYENENIRFKRDELDQRGKLGSRGLDVKAEGLDNTKEIAEKRLDVTQGNNVTKNNIAQQRADIYDYKTKHPNIQIVKTQGGNVHYYDPDTKTMRDSGVPSGTLSDADEIELRGKVQLKNTEAQGQNQLANIAANVLGRKEVAAAKPESETQNRVGTGNAARELVNKRPELAEFITFDDAGNPVVKAPSEGSFFSKAGPSKAQFDEINKALYPEKPVAKIVEPEKKIGEEKAPPAPKGWKYVKKPGGGWTAVEDKGGS